MCFLKVKVNHLTTLAVSCWSQLSLKQHQIHASLIQAYYISKFYKKGKKKMCWKSGGTVTSLGTENDWRGLVVPCIVL